MVRVLLAEFVLDMVIAAASDPLDAGLLVQWSLDDAIGLTTASGHLAWNRVPGGIL